MIRHRQRLQQHRRRSNVVDPLNVKRDLELVSPTGHLHRVYVEHVTRAYREKHVELLIYSVN